MNYLEIAEIFSGKYPTDSKKAVLRKLVTEKDLYDFREYLSISDSYVNGLNSTESSKEYFETFELLNNLVDKELQEDLFYTSKLGFFYEGVPSKLVYYLRKAIKIYNTPNNAISALDIRVMNQYLKPGILPNGVTLKQVMENLLGRKFELITKYKRYAKFGDITEFYVENTDRILVLPEELAANIESRKDIKSIKFNSGVGVCVQDSPIRTLGGKVGVTLDEYDLRGCK